MRSIVLACLFAVLAACTAPPPEGLKAGADAESQLASPPSLVHTLNDPPPQQPQPPGTQPPRVTEAGQEAAACAARGGNYQPVCLMGRPMCVLPHADAGKSCTDSSQCEGRCVVENGADPGKQVTGVCSRNNNPCGCFTLVQNGVSQPTLCAD